MLRLEDEGAGAIAVPTNVSWRMAFPVSADDGERMIISGNGIGSDGRHPPQYVIYFYIRQIWNIWPGDSQSTAGSAGGFDRLGRRYEFSSIGSLLSKFTSRNTFT